jgi:hypothetical protein
LVGGCGGATVTDAPYQSRKGKVKTILLMGNPNKKIKTPWAGSMGGVFFLLML